MMNAEAVDVASAKEDNRSSAALRSDEEIVAMYFSREQGAIEATADKYGKLLYAISVHIVHDKRDAEECVADAYLACWNTIPPTQPRSLKAYSGALCRNISLDKYKRAHAGKRGGGKTETLLSEIEEFLPADGTDYEENEAAAVINEFLSGLKKKERVIFVRRYWYADDVKEIAARLGEKEGTVKSLLFRLRQRLKKKLEEEGIGV
jgi:RNA polymerase sigma-70 factor (ECF subfamily)